MFDEVYGDHVRVVGLRWPVEAALSAPGDEKWLTESIELCGGTHLNNCKVIDTFDKF